MRVGFMKHERQVRNAKAGWGRALLTFLICRQIKGRSRGACFQLQPQGSQREGLARLPRRPCKNQAPQESRSSAYRVPEQSPQPRARSLSATKKPFPGAWQMRMGQMEPSSRHTHTHTVHTGAADTSIGGSGRLERRFRG